MSYSKSPFIVIIFLFASFYFAANGTEKIRLHAHYGFITAGYAHFTTSDTVLDGKRMQHTKLEFKTTNMVEKLFRFIYTFDSFYNPENYFPKLFSYNLIEKKNTYKDTIIYYHPKNYLETNKHGKMAFENSPRDLLSVISYLRKIDWSRYKKGESVTFDIIFREKEIFPVQIFYQGIETRTVKSGSYDCFKLYLTSEAGKLFVSDSKVSIYLSKDEKRIPISFTSEIFIGSFNLDMIEYENGSIVQGFSVQ